MTDARPTVAEIKARAHGLMLVLARELAPDRGSVDGIHYTACNPTRSDRSPGSFVIDVSGPTTGRWMEFAAGDSARTGEGGDVVDLVAYVHTGGTNFKSKAARGAAISWLGERVGLLSAKEAGRRAAPKQPRRTPDQIEADRRAAAFELQKQAKERDVRARRASNWWLSAGKPCAGAPTEIYLTRTRGLPMHLFKHWPGAIRHLVEIIDRHGEVHPSAMFCAMTATNANGDGEIRAVHRTFLTDAGEKDPDAQRPRKMFGDPAGAAVRLSKGGSSYSPERAARAGDKRPLVITEGIEDGLVAALLWPEKRVWAAGDVGLIGAIARIHGWPPCASELLICADNDPAELVDEKTGKARPHPATRALEASVQAWMAVSRGRPVAVARALGAHDLNDLWRAA